VFESSREEEHGRRRNGRAAGIERVASSRVEGSEQAVSAADRTTADMESIQLKLGHRRGTMVSSRRRSRPPFSRRRRAKKVGREDVENSQPTLSSQQQQQELGIPQFVVQIKLIGLLLPPRRISSL
jgi:hypothetical protein